MACGGWGRGVPIPSDGGVGCPVASGLVRRGCCSSCSDSWGPGWCRSGRARNWRRRAEDVARGPRRRGDGGVHGGGDMGVTAVGSASLKGRGAASLML